MILIIGVRFRKSGKVYYFDPAQLPVKKGNHVIVETARGVEYGTVVLGPKEIPDDQVVAPLKPVIRISTTIDDDTNVVNEIKEKDAFQVCLEKIKKHDLKMKLIDSEYTFDRNKLLFYFTADGRIDFRELVKDLAAVFRTRIELRQIGVRDETKLIGGMAICGRPLCCHSYLSDFVPVSIKMAKEQNLSLNPAKISGVCGRLMCCLKNEQDAYEYLNSTLPSIGTSVKTVDGYPGEVQSVSVLKQLVKVIINNEHGEKEVREYHVDDLNFDKKNKSKGAPIVQALPDEEIDKAELERLKQMEIEDLEELSENEDTPQNSNSNRSDNNRRRRPKPDNRRGRDNSDRKPRDNNSSYKKENRSRRDGGYKRDDNQKRDGGNKREGGYKRDDNQKRDGGYKRDDNQKRDGGYKRDDNQKRDGAPKHHSNDRYKNVKHGGHTNGK